MDKYEVSVVFATYNRKEMLERSLHLYEKQTRKDFEIIAISDDCSDGTYEMLRQWQSRLDIKIITLHKEAGKWRDCSSILNRGISMSRGRVCLLTQPEVMPGFKVIEYAALTPDWSWYSFKPYFMHWSWQQDIDEYDWMNLGVKAFRMIKNFYTLTDSPVFNKEDQYLPQNIEKNKNFLSWTIGSMTRKTLHEIGGLQEYETWGTVDPDFRDRRDKLGIPTITMMDDETLCCHQQHDSPRTYEKSMAALKKYNSREEAILCNL
jgi:hypothetical protein